MNKVSLLVLIISVSALFIFLISSYRSDISSLQPCINEWNAKNLKPVTDYVAGEIVVGFNENITESEATQLMNSYGLNFESLIDFDMLKHGYFLVHVPGGSEFEWICRLQKNKIVNSAELNGIMHAA